MNRAELQEKARELANCSEHVAIAREQDCGDGRVEQAVKNQFDAMNALLAFADSVLSERPRWETLPDSQGWWWHWSGRDLDIPFIRGILVSHTGGANRYFVADGNLAPWCDSMGGRWLKIEYPNIPERIPQSAQSTGQVAPSYIKARLSSRPEPLSERPHFVTCGKCGEENKKPHCYFCGAELLPEPPEGK